VDPKSERALQNLGGTGLFSPSRVGRADFVSAAADQIGTEFLISFPFWNWDGKVSFETVRENMVHRCIRFRRDAEAGLVSYAPPLPRALRIETL
jgi:hypothetical protein